MPKRTYGLAVRERTLKVLKVLLHIASLDLALPAGCRIDYRWLSTDSKRPKLLIQATITDLWQVCDQTETLPSLSPAEVRESLHALEGFLGILHDHRISTQGSPRWHFTLELWSTSTDENMAMAARRWQEKQAWKKAGIPQGQPLFQERDSMLTTQPADRLKSYYRWFVKTYGQIKILPNLTRRSIALDQIYVNVSVLAENAIKHPSAQDVEAFTDRFTQRHPLIDSGRLEDGVQVAQRHPWLMVLGLPGSGKSTFLRKLGLEAIKTAPANNQLCIPVLVELKLFSQQSLDLVGYLQQEIYRQPMTSDHEMLIDHLRQGHLLVLLDGLDEVPPAQMSHCIDQIRHFVRRFDANRVVMSCRTADYSYGLSQFVDVEVVSFSDAQIQQFIEHWFTKAQPQKVLSTSLWQSLNQSRNLPIKELARSPLLLFYLCLVYEMGISLPESRSQIYARILDIFLADWPCQKNIYSASNPAPRPTAYANKQLLARLAYDQFCANHLVIYITHLQRTIKDFLADQPERSVSGDPGRWLKEIKSRQGILVERFQGYFSFSHLTLQEYLAAQYVVEHPTALPVLIQHSADRRWREVVLIVMDGLEENGLDLAASIYEMAWDRLLAHPPLLRLLQGIQQCSTALFGGVPTLAQRASVAVAVSVIAAARSSDLDMSIAVGPIVAVCLVRASDSAMAMADEAIAAAGVNSALALATARTLVVDEERTAAINQVIHNSDELIDQASEGKHGEEKRTDNSDKARVIGQALANSRDQVNQMLIAPSHCLPTDFIQLPTALSRSVDTLPSLAESSDWLPWAHQLEQCWLQVLGLERATVTLTIEEASAWETYLYQCELISRSLSDGRPALKAQGQALRARLLHGN